MSQLESMLTQLKKTLSEQRAGAAPVDIKTPTPAIDPKTASNALKDFLAKSGSTSREAKTTALEDPQIIVERRKALSVFVGVSLSNNGRAALPGTIDMTNIASSSHSGAHGGHNSHAKGSDKGHAQQHTSGGHQASIPCPKCVDREVAERNAARVNATVSGASNPTPAAPAQGAASVQPAVKSSVIWYKHIQAVESAMRIGDMHFADSLLSLLFETATSLSAEANINARLKSLQARVLADRKMFAEAEKLLIDTIRGLEGTQFSKDIAAAYCWRALAQCLQNQKKSEQAEKARQKALSIAVAALGEKDPEAMMFNEALAP